MQIGLIGLGKMGSGIASRLRDGGHSLVVFDQDSQRMGDLAVAGVTLSDGLDDCLNRVASPRMIWTMLPAGEATELVFTSLRRLLAPGDIVLDGGNSHFKDSMKRCALLRKKGVAWVDVGVSGGVHGRVQGYCLMVGGDRSAVERAAPLFQCLAQEGGWSHLGPSGAGHYAKMIHNGVEYAFMAALAEGCELMERSAFGLDVAEITRLWSRGSLVQSRLLDLLVQTLSTKPEFEKILPFVKDSGYGRGTVVESIDRGVPAPTLTAALQSRFFSQQEDSYTFKLLSLLRNQFGGHAVKEK